MLTEGFGEVLGTRKPKCISYRGDITSIFCKQPVSCRLKPKPPRETGYGFTDDNPKNPVKMKG